MVLPSNVPVVILICKHEWLRVSAPSRGGGGSVLVGKWHQLYFPPEINR